MAHKMGMIGKKLGMTHVFEESGERIPVTVLQMGPNVVVGKREADKHNYSALVLGFEEKKATRVNKPDAGNFAKSEIKPQKTVREFRIPAEALANYQVGQSLAVGDVFAKGLAVDVTGVSKGKGFQGVMKRHNMSGAQTVSHGTHEYFRHGGSIGCRLTPGRVLPGKRMAGQMGNETMTVQNLEIVEVVPEDNLLLIRGGIPGGKNTQVVVKQASKLEFYKRKGQGGKEVRSKNPLKASKRGGN